MRSSVGRSKNRDAGGEVGAGRGVTVGLVSILVAWTASREIKGGVTDAYIRG